MLDQEQWLAAVAQAARAPSPHNAQPARWMLRGDHVRLLADSKGWLTASDPGGRDDLVALGMAWEAMKLVLSTLGLALMEPVLARTAAERAGSSARVVADGNLLRGATRDPLAEWQDKRRCWRGSFAAATREQVADLDRCLGHFADVVTSLDEASHERLARWYDAAAAEGLRNAAVARELYAFLRFSKRHPRWERDGLAADCMALSRFEAWGASWLMRPAMLSLLGKLGLLGMVVSEKPKVLSATRLVLVHAAADESPFEAGRRWYRFWLGLTAAGFSGVPMSALVDSPRYSAELLAGRPLAPDRCLVNVMRVGPSPEAVAPRSARLPAAELVISASGIR